MSKNKLIKQGEVKREAQEQLEQSGNITLSQGSEEYEEGAERSGSKEKPTASQFMNKSAGFNPNQKLHGGRF